MLLPETFVVRPSKIVWFAWILPQLIGGLALIQLIVWEIYYSLLGGILFIISYYSFRQWKQQYRINPLVGLKQISPPKKAFWELSFKNGCRQKIELVRYYRNSFLIIFIYKPLYPTRAPICSYIVFYDALSSRDYRALSFALWPG